MVEVEVEVDVDVDEAYIDGEDLWSGPLGIVDSQRLVSSFPDEPSVTWDTDEYEIKSFEEGKLVLKKRSKDKDKDKDKGKP